MYNLLHTSSQMSPTTATTTCNQIPVGDLHCQRQPYDKELTTTCIDCSEKPDKKGFYQIKLHDTGTLFSFPLEQRLSLLTMLLYQFSFLKVVDNLLILVSLMISLYIMFSDKGIEHVHYTKAPVAVGKQVTVKVDWDRRW